MTLFTSFLPTQVLLRRGTRPTKKPDPMFTGLCLESQNNSQIKLRSTLSECEGLQ